MQILQRSIVQHFERACASSEMCGTCPSDLRGAGSGMYLSAWFRSSLGLYIRASQTVSLLECAAMICFHDLELPTLKALGKEYVPDFPANEDLFGTLLALVTNILPERTSDFYTAIMQKRLIANSEDLAVYLEVEGALECFGEDDEVEMEEETRAEKESKLALVQYAKKYDAYRRKNLPKRRNRSKNDDRFDGRKFVGSFPSGEISQRDAKEMLPPGKFFIAKYNPSASHKSGAWYSNCPPYPQFSISWAKAGSEREALRIVLQHCWSIYLREQMLDGKSCPIKGLFD